MVTTWEQLAYEDAEKGASLAIVDKREKQIEKVVERARVLGSPQVLHICADVSNINDLPVAELGGVKKNSAEPKVMGDKGSSSSNCLSLRPATDIHYSINGEKALLPFFFLHYLSSLIWEIDVEGRESAAAKLCDEFRPQIFDDSTGEIGKSKEGHSKISSNMIYRPVNMECNEGVLKAEGEDRNRETKKGKQLIDSSGKVFGQISSSPLLDGGVIPSPLNFIQDEIKSRYREGVSGLNQTEVLKEGSLISKSNDDGRVATSNLGDVERKKIIDESHKDENKLDANLEEKENKEGECDTNSSKCDDMYKIESSDIFVSLGESKSSSQMLAQSSTSAPCSNVVEKDGFKKPGMDSLQLMYTRDTVKVVEQVLQPSNLRLKLSKPSSRQLYTLVFETL
ncbi:hypothetical protein LguiB_024587 [Lonicera macranthoides]